MAGLLTYGSSRYIRLPNQGQWLLPHPVAGTVTLAIYSCGGSCRLDSRGETHPCQSFTAFPFHPFARDHRLTGPHHKVLPPYPARHAGHICLIRKTFHNRPMTGMDRTCANFKNINLQFEIHYFNYTSKEHIHFLGTCREYWLPLTYMGMIRLMRLPFPGLSLRPT